MGMRDTGASATSVSESRLREIWRKQLCVRQDFVSREGAAFRIIYPGRTNCGQGPDILDAVIAWGNRLVRGDIEFHVKSSRWREHRHHLDPFYNQVILHVVLQPDEGPSATLANGQTVNTLSLSQYAGSNVSRGVYGALPCQKLDALNSGDRLYMMLDRLGDERFLAKAARFELDSDQTESAQCLYQEIMEALGYSRNRQPFRELARRLPLGTLERYAHHQDPDKAVAVRQALLLGAAGLLPSQRALGSYAEGLAVEMEQTWSTNRPVMSMCPGQWRFSGVRPANLPSRRIVAMSYLIPRLFTGINIKSTVKSMLRLSIPDLLKLLMVPSAGFWQNHGDFDVPSSHPTGHLLGRGRASEIIVNILLPFAFTTGRRGDRSGIARRALSLYRGFPRLPPNNIERHMRTQLGWTIPGLARRQQGLLHLYREFCSQGKCRDCPLAAMLAGAR